MAKIRPLQEAVNASLHQFGVFQGSICRRTYGAMFKELFMQNVSSRLTDSFWL